MPASTKLRVPVYRHHKPSGLASVRIEGRDIYLGPHGTPDSRAEYKRVIAEWLANHHAQPNGTNGHTPAMQCVVDELIAAYLDFAKTYYVKNGTLTGEYRNIGDALRPLTTLYGRTRVADFGPSALKAVRHATSMRTAQSGSTARRATRRSTMAGNASSTSDPRRRKSCGRSSGRTVRRGYSARVRRWHTSTASAAPLDKLR